MQNKVELMSPDGYYGSDEIIACSAWTSTSRDLNDEKRGRIGKLIKMLWENGHETPFEKGIVHFLVDTDIASHIHLLKHRISSLNAESARYKELKEDKMYIPEDWKNLEGISNHWHDTLNEFSKTTNKLYHRCLEDLTPILGRKRAKESARFFKTMNSQITMDISFNFRSFVHFQGLRNSEHSQKEVRELAQQMLELVKNIKGNPFKLTLEAFKL